MDWISLLRSIWHQGGAIISEEEYAAGNKKILTLYLITRAFTGRDEQRCASGSTPSSRDSRPQYQSIWGDPKVRKPGKWHLIIHVGLSYHKGRSVNSGIDPQLHSRTTRSGGRELAELDMKSAYRIVPVHLEDRLQLGMQWQERVYADAALPFGLWSAPKVYNNLADVLA